ncbi:hypothetical protein [Peribacillus simplex]
MMNGKEYLESLRDGRTVFLNGDKNASITYILFLADIPLKWGLAQ